VPITNNEELLRALLAATTPEAVRAILEEIGDFGDADLDRPFGHFQFCWHAFGNNQSNISSIGLATKPGRSLTERQTNMTDAILEDRAPAGVPLPHSAREAAQQWFGRPVSGPEDGLFSWDYAAHDYDRRMSLVMSDSGVDGAPTVDALDDGIGIKPEDFPGTILSLQSGNKITKWYLMGAFGQGGASTLAFCDYAVIVSRNRDNPRVIGFTVIREIKLNERYKEDCYGYLCLKAPSGGISVPSCQLEEEALAIYPAHTGPRVPVLRKGTLVRHVAYQLPKLAGSLQASPGNLYHYLHVSAFDPLLPFRLIDLRNGKFDNEIVTGSRNRLMKLNPWDSDTSPKSVGSYLRYHREMEYFAPHGTQEPCIGIEFWVVFNYRKRKIQDREQVILRAQSNELFVQTGHPVIGTLNGQNQGELTAQMLKDLHLGMVAQHIIIHLDASKADSRVRRELFSTNREGFKDGAVLTSLVELLEKMLSEDETLKEIERELTEKLAKRESQATREDVKRQIVKLLQEAGLNVEVEGPVLVPGQGEGTEPVKRKRGRRPPRPAPLPTLPFPQVTKFAIIYPKPKMSVHINDSETVLIETDADSEYDRRGLVAIRSEPDCLELAGKSPLNGGRIRWRMRPRPTAKAGDVGRIIVSLTRLDGTQLCDSTDFEVLPSLEQRVKKAKGQVPKFEVIPINPVDDPEQWTAAWPHLSEEATPDELATVAYKPVTVGGGIIVYYSTIFRPFQEQMERLKTDSPSLPALFRDNYEVWIGYHAILQENSRSSIRLSVADEELERLLEEDRERVARMQVKQARSTAELMNRVMQERNAE
jgi:hypothetical protein